MQLLSRFRQILSLPLPRTTVRGLLTESAFLGFFIAVFLLIFQPFGTYEFNPPYKTQRLLGYGVVIFFSYIPIKWGLLSLFKERAYTFKKELLVVSITFLLLAAICFLYFKKVVYPAASWGDFPDFMVFCFAICFLPLVIVLYSQYSRGLRLAEASPTDTPDAENTLELYGANQSESFLFREADIIYLQSSGNYVEIHFIQDERVKSVLLRSTLSQMLAQVPVQSFRVVHRSYVVNQRHFSHFTKAAGKGTLAAEKWNIEVPVSRANLALAEQIARDFR